ncbi:NADH-ubiquinone oxidoreductase chain L [Patulibacter medicamentivorans]|uniref:NADH-ubiquinone oxidoreductase chain L n=1 Tax=Patulibacter medicamentivorans TaxID=1097667 RepID=H0E150_9ACTN|nr:NADH-quinone oxidoreductase subunit L [Patulibacter medicamentivorans]EHN12625.1 NADH-ubiquinone oxidoreductase chain L [Patulibacter medicamentivorans]
MSPTAAGWIVLALPLFGAIVLGLGFKAWKGVAAGILGTATVGLGFVFSLLALIGLQGKDEESRQIASSLWTYAKVGGVDVKMEILVDPLSIVMLLVVTGVSTLIHLYSLAYMRGDAGYGRFFSYLNFFVFSMLLLVLASNFVLLIVGWAFVGAASYMLISYWYRRTTATSAGIKAFVINVVGDIGLVLGAILLLSHTGTVDFIDTFAAAEHTFGPGSGSTGSLTAGLLLIMIGAFAKSAQLPLHTWLPDAMEGPTPVSSLIHAATMVTAGVYLIARLHPLMELSTTAQTVGAIVGLLTLLVAGTIGLTQTDLKRVIAYSTMSQIGYMIMGVSAGAYVAGMFHLVTHAFFKALLFMAAGSLIAAMAGEQSLDKMRGFRKAMPFTFAAFVIGGLALAGIPPFSGFFSKDEILAVLAEQGGWHWILVVGGYVGAFLTAVYTWRMIFRAFWGEPCPEAKELEEGHLHHAEVHRNPATGEVEDTDVGFPGPEHHIAERATPMRVAMGGLAVLAILGGLLGIPFGILTPLEHFLEPTFADIHHPVHPGDGITAIGLLVGTGLGLAGIYVAYLVWARPQERGEAPTTISAGWQQRFAPVHRLFVNKWYFDELINALIVTPFRAFGRFAHDSFERLVIGGAIVGGATGATRGASALVRRLQSGYLRSYSAVLLSGLVVVLVYFLAQS